VSERSRANWIVAAFMTVAVLVPAATVVGVLVGARGPDPSDARAPAASLPVQSAAPARPLEPTAAVNPPNMIQLHDSMMDQMRASLDASMNELMNRDPMWQMMRSSTYLDALERHEQDIDRMLARGG
jgi:hypothetical protein